MLFRSNFNRANWQEKWALRDVPAGSASVSCITQAKEHLGIRVRENNQGEIVTGHISTQNTFSFQYGYAEARMRFFGPQGAHSAFWFQTHAPYATPAHTEVNVAEHFGRPSIWQNVYWSEDGMPPAPDAPSFKEKSDMIAPYAWHTYGCEVTPMGYTFNIDGIVTGYFPMLGDIEHYLILSFIADDWERKHLTKPYWQYRTHIDYVKVEEL